MVWKAANNIDTENATYNGWLSEHFVSSVIIFAPDGIKFKYAECQSWANDLPYFKEQLYR